jgi:hypothetical protein
MSRNSTLPALPHREYRFDGHSGVPLPHNRYWMRVAEPAGRIADVMGPRAQLYLNRRVYEAGGLLCWETDWLRPMRIEYPALDPPPLKPALYHPSLPCPFGNTSP